MVGRPVKTEVGLRSRVVDGELYVAVDDLLVALSAAEVTWEHGGGDVRFLRLFAGRVACWARTLTR